MNPAGGEAPGKRTICRGFRPSPVPFKWNQKFGDPGLVGGNVVLLEIDDNSIGSYKEIFRFEGGANQRRIIVEIGGG